jgi:hypothetical protein
MATITKKAANRINELLSIASIYSIAARRAADSADECNYYWSYSLKNGVAVRALFDEFGIEVEGLTWFTEDRIEELRAQVEAARKAARQAA